MAQITAALISTLREMTSAGMMDCKNALSENNGDVQAAADWLRQKGIVKAAKKADRVAANGLVAVAKSNDNTVGVLVELNAETDFVAKNDKFQKLVTDVTAKALELNGDIEATREVMKDEIAATISTIGENMTLRRMAKVEGDAVYTYVHNAIAPNMGQIGVIVALNGDIAASAEIGPKIAMHIAASKPEFATIADVDPIAVEREKKIFIESGVTAGKPENVVEGMIAGRVKKFYGESVLEEQPFVMNPDKTVKQTLADAGATLAGYAYFLLGEGVEKVEENLADAVNQVLKG